MILENDWLTTNVLDFKSNRNIKEVRCEFVPGDFEDSSFMDAATKVANTIKNKYEHIYVAYSGGADSEFIVNILHSVGANITPIAVEAKHTTEELQRAYANCKKLGLNLVVLDFMGEEKDKALRRLFQHYIMNDTKTWIRGFISTFFFLIIHDYIKQIHSDAILINGHWWCQFNVSFQKDWNQWLQSWVLFTSFWEKESASMLPFFLYNQHIMYEMCNYKNKHNCSPYLDKPTSYMDVRSDMFNIPRKSKIQAWKKMDLEWKNFYMNASGWISAGSEPPKFREKGSDSNYRTFAQIWRSLKS